MLTPIELEKLEFDKHLGGYKRASVDDAMELIRSDYETIYRENIALRDKISMLEELVSKYKAMEDTLQSSIILAQQSGDAAVAAAREKADAIIKSAQEQARIMGVDAENEQKKLRELSLKMRKDISVFAVQNISLLEGQVELLKHSVGMCLEEELGDDDFLLQDERQTEPQLFCERDE